MSDLEQTNVRIPRQAKETILLLARRLREDKAFLARLRRFLDEDQDPGVGALLSSRIDRLEGQLHSLAGELASSSLRIGVQIAEDGTSRMVVRSAEPAATTWQPTPSWTTGEGKGRRLTPEGRAEMDRMIASGSTDIEIAKALGIKTYAVTQRRKRKDDTAIDEDTE